MDYVKFIIKNIQKKYKWIKGYSLNDLSPINIPKWLETFILNHLKISTIKRLENNEIQLILTQKWLRSLNINYDLDQLRTLEELELGNNAIVDISQLKTLINLQYLYLSNNEIKESSKENIKSMNILYLYL